MAGERTLKLTIIGDASSAVRAMDQADEKSGKLSGTLGTMAKVAGGFVIGAGLLQLPGLIGGAIDKASDANETLSKSNTIFGDNAKAMEDWAAGGAKAFGQSKTQALDAAATFGNLFAQLGIGQEKTAGMSRAMVELATDFASFHNADISEVLSAQTAAFRGEFDAVQRFVPTINAAAVEQKALEMGLGRTTKELDAQDKALATQALLLEGAGAAAGDYERTSESLANKQKRQAAEMANLTEIMGQKLLPVQLAVTAAFIDHVIPAFQKVGDFLATHVVPAVTALAERFRADVLPAIQEAIPVIQAFAVDVLGTLAKTFEADILPKLQQVGAFLMDPVLPAFSALGAVIKDDVFPVLRDFANFLADHKEFLAGLAIAVAVVLVPAFVAWAVAAGAAAVATIVATAPVIAITAVIALLVTGIIYAIKHWDEISAALGRFKDAVVEQAGKALDWLLKLPAKFMQVGSDMIDGLINGIRAKADALVAAIRMFVTDMIPDFVRRALGSFSPSKVFEEIGYTIGEGLAAGIKDSRGLPLTEAEALARELATYFSNVTTAGSGLGYGGRWGDMEFFSTLREGAKGVVAGLGGQVETGLLAPVQALHTALGNLADMNDEMDANAQNLEAIGIGVARAMTVGEEAVSAIRDWQTVADEYRSLGYHIPGYASGGIVPGALGSSQLAVVHGGETILPTHRGGSVGGGIVVNVTVQGALRSEHDLAQYITQVIAKEFRQGGFRSLGAA